MDFKDLLVKDIGNRIRAITPEKENNDIFDGTYSHTQELKEISALISRIRKNVDSSFHFSVKNEIGDEISGRFLRMSLSYALSTNNFEFEDKTETNSELYKISFKHPFNNKKTIVVFDSSGDIDIENGSNISRVSFIGSDFDFGVFDFKERQLNRLLSWVLIIKGKK